MRCFFKSACFTAISLSPGTMGLMLEKKRKDNKSFALTLQKNNIAWTKCNNCHTRTLLKSCLLILVKIWWNNSEPIKDSQAVISKQKRTETLSSSIAVKWVSTYVNKCFYFSLYNFFAQHCFSFEVLCILIKSYYYTLAWLEETSWNHSDQSDNMSASASWFLSAYVILPTYNCSLEALG